MNFYINFHTFLNFLLQHSDEFEILDYLEDDLYEDSDEEWEAPEPTVEPIDTVRLGPNTLYYSGFIIKESADSNSIINYSSRFKDVIKGSKPLEIV